MPNFLQTLIVKSTAIGIFSIFFSISLGFLFTAEAVQIPDGTNTGEAGQMYDGTDLVFDEKPSNEVSDKRGAVPSLLTAYVFEPVRLTVRHEVAYKTEEPDGIINNRSSVRLEYSKFFLGNYFFQFDSKITAFWGNDHRAKAEAKDILFEPRTREAFLQASFGRTSIKAGIQILIWGESDAGAITDVISPRDYSELFLTALEDSRIGQPMLIIDQFSLFGDWSFFFVPYPEYNKYPKKGTAYYSDAFRGSAVYQNEKTVKNYFEYGGRWRKTFGKSDISFMGASLIDNDYAYRLDGFTGSGKLLITKIKQRFTMAGMTFNYAMGNYLFKGEVGLKSPKDFNNADLQIVKKDVVDSSLGLQYSPGGTFISSLEGVNSHVIGWNDEIQGVPDDTNSLVISVSDKFFNEDLTVNWMTYYIEPYTYFLHTLITSYRWIDNVTLFLEGYYPDVRDKRSGYWIYRDQKQVVFKVQYQF